MNIQIHRAQPEEAARTEIACSQASLGYRKLDRALKDDFTIA
jgi:hypothetical protein